MNDYQPHHVEVGARMMLAGIGLDTDDPAIKGTPARVARAMAEMTDGYRVDVKALLATGFESAGYDEVVMLRGISFHSLCEHHLMTFRGTAMVAYLPSNGKVVGLSKLARLVEVHARRLQLQERMTHDIADDLEEHLETHGVAVIIKAEHFCMCARGINKPGAEMITSTLRGGMRENPALRMELLSLWGGG